jgi:adenylate cyclase
VGCGACGAANTPWARFCDQCGARLSGTEPAAARIADDGDRRIVTAVFADIVDYVRMIAESDPEDVRRRVDAALTTMDEAVRRFGGTREKFIGDAIFAVFGHPVAHDDDALRAAQCALDIRASLGEASATGGPLQVRIGISTGEVVAARREVPGSTDIGLTGPVVVTAARIQSLASPGEVLVDEATVRAARDRLITEPRGSELLRGQATPIELHTLGGEHGLVARMPLTLGRRLIGREPERAALVRALAACRDSGRGSALLVVGDAGLGKSRLLAELEPDARAQGFAWTWTENASYGSDEPYRFVRAFAQAVADERGVDSGTLARELLFTAELDPETAHRLAGGIAAIAREAAFDGWEEEARWAPTEPAQVASALGEVATRYARRIIEEFGPRVVVVDDLHWIDRSSLGLLERLLRASGDLPYVVLIGSRPGPMTDWAADLGVERVDLGGLAPDETSELAADVAGAALAPTDARLVHDRTEGNPLFVGETVRALLEDGALQHEDGWLRIAEPEAADMLPVTLRAVLGARIDALPRELREPLGVAAVVGNRFAGPIVGELLGGGVTAALERLAATALIAPEEPGTWRFAHALIRDVAYAGLLASRRRELHGRLADRLERDPATSAGILARHRAAAGEPERAVPLFVAAAAGALAIGARDEAAASWRQAARLTRSAEEAEEYRRRADEIAATASRVPTRS